MVEPSKLFWFGAFAGVLAVRSFVQHVRHLKTKKKEKPHPASASKCSGSQTSGQGVVEDEETLKAIERLSTAFNGLVTSCIIYVGDATNLYKTLSETGPITSQKLSQVTGFNERWLREWLYQGAAAQILTYNPDKQTFDLPKPYVRTLLEPTEKQGTNSVIGMFQFAPAMAARISSLVTVLETGIGQTYDASFKEDIQRAIRTMHFDFAKNKFCDNVLFAPQLGSGDLVTRMQRGEIRVAEVGFGAGLCLCEMARRFPKTSFQGYEVSEEAISLAKEEAHRQRLKNVQFLHAIEQPMPKDTFDFVYVFDVIHDCSDPLAVLKSVAHSLKRDGLFFVVDIEAHDDPLDNILHPAAEARFGISCGLCLHSSCSEGAAGSAGLGTLGLSKSVFTKLADQAGLTLEQFTLEELPSNFCYVLRHK